MAASHGRRLRSIGAVLLIASAPALLAMAREISIDRAIVRTYWRKDVPPAREGTMVLKHGEHVLEISDTAGTATEHHLRVRSQVQVKIDGEVVFVVPDVEVRPAWNDENRWWGFLRVQYLGNRTTGTTAVVVAAALGPRQFGTASVPVDGAVTIERFDLSSLCALPVRHLVVRDVLRSPLGYCSDALQTFPSLLYPVLYPWGTSILSVILIACGFKSRSAIDVRRQSGRS